MASLMMRTALLVLCLFALAAPCWAATPIGGSTGTFVVHCPVDGSRVWFDNDFKGAISGGALSVPVYTTATPYQTYRVEADGYEPFLGMITRYPASGGTIDLQATLVREPIGGSMGAYRFTANVEGAYVYLDGEFQGAIENGSLVVPVFTTGTPFRNYAVQARGFLTATGAVPRVPAAGETVAIAVTLIPRTAPTAIGGDRGAYLVLCPVEGAMVAFDGDSKGTIQNGELLVPVYTTGTPYRTWSVTKEGYATFNGTISVYPAKGQTIDLQAALTVLPTTVVTTNATTAVPTTTRASLSSVCIVGALLSLAALGLAGRRR